LKVPHVLSEVSCGPPELEKPMDVPAYEKDDALTGLQVIPAEASSQVLPLNWYPELQPAHMLALFVVQDAPVAAVPLEQEQEFAAQELPLKW
jgi:hypothetical protein